MLNRRMRSCWCLRVGRSLQQNVPLRCIEMTLASVSQLAPLIGFKVEGLLLHPRDPLQQVQGPSCRATKSSLAAWHIAS